jgi:hypothetical protein
MPLHHPPIITLQGVGVLKIMLDINARIGYN